MGNVGGYQENNEFDTIQSDVENAIVAIFEYESARKEGKSQEELDAKKKSMLDLAL